MKNTMSTTRDKSKRAGIRQLRTSLKWRFLEPVEDSFLGLTSMKAEYDAGLEDCVAAAREALRALEFVITGGALQEGEARIDARSELAELVFIHITATGRGGRTEVFFHAGRYMKAEGTDLIQKLREEFEQWLNDPARKPSPK